MEFREPHEYFKNTFPSSDFCLIKQTMEPCLRDVTEWAGSQDIGGKCNTRIFHCLESGTILALIQLNFSFHVYKTWIITPILQDGCNN